MKAKKIFCVIAYDIQNDRKRNKVAKLLESYGERINFSVFECMFTHSQFSILQEKIEKLIDIKTDTVVYYRICLDCYTKTVYQPDKRKTYNKIEVI